MTDSVFSLSVIYCKYFLQSAISDCEHSAMSKSAMLVSPEEETDIYFGQGQMRCLTNGNYDPMQVRVLRCTRVKSSWFFSFQNSWKWSAMFEKKLLMDAITVLLTSFIKKVSYKFPFTLPSKFLCIGKVTYN